MSADCNITSREKRRTRGGYEQGKKVYGVFVKRIHYSSLPHIATQGRTRGKKKKKKGYSHREK